MYPFAQQHQNKCNINIFIFIFQQLKDEIAEVTSEMETMDISEEKYVYLLICMVHVKLYTFNLVRSGTLLKL